MKQRNVPLKWKDYFRPTSQPHPELQKLISKTPLKSRFTNTPPFYTNRKSCQCEHIIMLCLYISHSISLSISLSTSLFSISLSFSLFLSLTRTFFFQTRAKPGIQLVIILPIINIVAIIVIVTLVITIINGIFIINIIITFFLSYHYDNYDHCCNYHH